MFQLRAKCSQCARYLYNVPSQHKLALVCLLLFSLACLSPWTVALQAPLPMGFPRQDYQSGLPLPSPGHLPGPGIEPTSPALAGRFFTTEPPGKPLQKGGFFTQSFSNSQLFLKNNQSDSYAKEVHFEVANSIPLPYHFSELYLSCHCPGH